jgi:hypothetical protein
LGPAAAAKHDNRESEKATSFEMKKKSSSKVIGFKFFYIHFEVDFFSSFYKAPPHSSLTNAVLLFFSLIFIFFSSSFSLLVVSWFHFLHFLGRKGARKTAKPKRILDVLKLYAMLKLHVIPPGMFQSCYF